MKKFEVFAESAGSFFERRQNARPQPPYRPTILITILVAPQGDDFWTKPFALVVVLLLVTLEWLTKKQSGLI